MKLHISTEKLYHSVLVTAILWYSVSINLPKLFNEFLKVHQEKREKAKDQLSEFLLDKP